MDTKDRPTRTRRPPTRFTPEVTARIIDAIREGCTREASASAGPVSRSTLQAWIRQGQLYPDGPHAVFAEAVDEAEQDAIRTMVADIREQGRKDWRALAWLLQTRPSSRGQFLKPIQGVEVSGPQGGPIEVEDRARDLAESVRDFQAGREAGEAFAADRAEP